MKSKTLSYNQSQNNHQSTTTTSNSTNPSNRNKNTTRCSDSKYSSVLVASKLSKIKENDKDICNNNNNNDNNEESGVDNDCTLNSDISVVINDSINNNSIIIDNACKDILEALTNSSDYVDSNECNITGTRSLCNDEDSNNTDCDNSADIDEECRKSSCCIVENRTNLIVNYLPQNMSQEDMRVLFSNIGEVESCKLIRDKTTGQSLSYGFVNYQDAKDASKAMQQFNGLRLQNKVIKVSLARPSSETIKGANLYICGLPKSMSQVELEQLFSQYGTIITCRILVDNVTGNSKGVAFIRFDRRHEAETAIKNLNGFTPTNDTEPITVKLANTPFNINNSTNSQLTMVHNQHNEYITTSPNHLSSNNNGRCMIPNMRSMATTCSDIIPRLDGILQNNGHQSSGVIAPDFVQSSGPSLQNGYQKPFPTGQMICPPQMHQIAAFQMGYPGIQHPCIPQGPSTVPTNSILPVNGTHQTSQYLSIDPMTASAHLMEGNLCCLVVYNLGPEAKEASLWQTFGPYGAVHSVSLVKDPATGKCTGFGFVTMPNYHEAILAAQQLNGNPLDNRTLQILMNPSLKMPTINQYILPSMAP